MRCRDCHSLFILSTGSQIISVCLVTKRFKNYGELCDVEEKMGDGEKDEERDLVDA